MSAEMAKQWKKDIEKGAGFTCRAHKKATN